MSSDSSKRRSNGRILFLLAMLSCILAVVQGAATAPDGEPAWLQAAPDYLWNFPGDHGVHRDYKTEWWYFTGHLFPRGEPAAPAMAFQLTFFRIGLLPDGPPALNSDWATAGLVMAHASVTDPARDRHIFSEVLWREIPLLGGFGTAADSTLAWCRAPAGTDSLWSVTWDGDAFRLRARDRIGGLGYDLVCRPEKPLVFHGEGGFSPKSPDGQTGSLYFSYTRMSVTGSIIRGDSAVDVSGTSWMDREIFTSTLARNQTGWDWLSLQLDDGRELMVYRLRGTSPADDFALGTLVGVDGRVETIPSDRWSLQPQQTWQSPDTGSKYPVQWRLQVPSADLDLELRATLPEQENVSARSGVHYWEGAVTAHPWNSSDEDSLDSKAVGRGFVELTGYGEGSRPPV